jgi:hypothetical protein
VGLPNESNTLQDTTESCLEKKRRASRKGIDLVPNDRKMIVKVFCNFSLSFLLDKHETFFREKIWTEKSFKAEEND